MNADDLRHAVHQADADVADATRQYLAILDSAGDSLPPTDGLIVLNRAELLLYMGSLTAIPPDVNENMMARSMEQWVETHDLTPEFERFFRRG